MRYYDSPYTYIHKFGRNPDVDAAASEDVWDGGGEYPFPAAAAVPIVYSDVAGDDDGDSGAHAVVLEGLDADFKEISETIRLNGTTTATAVQSYIRTHRMLVTSAGSNSTNIGQISCEVGGVLTAQISSDMGQTLMAIYTTPKLDPRDKAYVLGWDCHLPTTSGLNAATVRLQLRTTVGAWQTKDLAALDESNRIYAVVYPDPVETSEKCDIRVRVDSVSANNTVVAAGFDVVYTRRYHRLR